MLMYHLGRSGEECAWSENAPAMEMLRIPEEFLGRMKEGRRRKRKAGGGKIVGRGSLCEETVIGDCVLLRRDGKGLTVEQVEGLLAFLTAGKEKVDAMDCGGRRGYSKRWLEREEREAEERKRWGPFRSHRKRELEEDDEDEDDGRSEDECEGASNSRKENGVMTPSDAGYESGFLSEEIAPAGREFFAVEESVNGGRRKEREKGRERERDMDDVLYPARTRINRANFEAFWTT